MPVQFLKSFQAKIKNIFERRFKRRSERRNKGDQQDFVTALITYLRDQNEGFEKEIVQFDSKVETLIEKLKLLVYMSRDDFVTNYGELLRNLFNLYKQRSEQSLFREIMIYELLYKLSNEDNDRKYNLDENFNRQWEQCSQQNDSLEGKIIELPCYL